MKNSETIKELKQLIYEEIGDCNTEEWGKLCELRQTKDGYEKIEEMVHRMVLKEGYNIGSALAHIQMELDHQIN